MSHPKVRVGTFYLLLAQGVFLVTAYGLHIILGRYLGPTEYGLFGVVLYAATMIRTFVASGFPMAVSRYVSAEPDKAEIIFRKGFFLQVLVASSISLAFFICAPWLGLLLDDQKLVPLFRIVAPITIFFGAFYLVIQYYNGLRKYSIQAFWLTISYLLRACFAITLTLVGFRVLGAVAGLVLANASAAILILIGRRSGDKKGEFSSKLLISFSVPLILSSIGHAFLVDLDLMFVKKLVPGAASSGYYTSAKAMAHAVPFAFFALSGALFPAISNAYSSGDFDTLKGYIKKANRLLLFITAPIIVLVLRNAAGIIGFIYGKDYLSGAESLQWLIVGFSFLAFFIIHKTIITGCGFPKVSSAITLTLVPVCVILQLFLIPAYGLVGAAMASTLTFFLGVLASTIFINWKLKGGFAFLSSIKIIGSTLAVLGMDILLTGWGVILIPKLMVLSACYITFLWILGEWSPEQLRDLMGPYARQSK